jgi:broad specificity phosphatase PhoE
MKLIITRHGETEENKKRILQGHIHGNLSELGKEQAKKVAKRLGDEKIDHIFSSDLRRAGDTAIEIAKAHPHTPLEFVKELRELNMGGFQGKKAPSNLREERYNKGFFKNVGGEEYEELVLRVKNFLETLIPKFYGKTVLLVAHNGTGQAIITALLNKEWEYIKEMGRLENTSITIFEFDENKNPVLKLMNCMKHLDE